MIGRVEISDDMAALLKLVDDRVIDRVQELADDYINQRVGHIDQLFTKDWRPTDSMIRRIREAGASA
jgi:hypothetical protein